MQIEKINKHQATFDVYLKRLKNDFESVLSAPLKERGTLRDFYINKTLGTGSFGRVYLVRHAATKKNLAMKVIEKRNVVKTNQVEHTITEVRMLDAFKFFFIVSSEYLFKDNVYLYLVMPFIPGGEMFTQLRRLRKFDESLCKFYASQIILCFEYMHFMGVVYRDLKPENILINTDGYLVVTDLGFCKKIDDHRTYTLCDQTHDSPRKSNKVGRQTTSFLNHQNNNSIQFVNMTFHDMLSTSKMSMLGDDEKRMAQHYVQFQIFLAKAKAQFEGKLQMPMTLRGDLTEFDTFRTLGTGAFGRVILVKHKKTGKIYAMKMLDKEYIVRKKQVEHTISEIRMLDSFRFPFIIRMDLFFVNSVYIFIFMPLISGGEMFSHLRRMRKFDENLTKFYSSQVILSIEYMHYLGVVYRDLKPENILIDKDGYILVTDLGFCKKIDETRTYTLCGTPEYLAPEIILSQGYNYSVDWWAVGILIYEMAAGYPPFYAKDPMKIYEKIVAGKYICPGHFSKPLKDLLSNIIQVDRSKRYGNLKGGVNDIKKHEWFRNVDYDLILNKKIRPSFKPTVSGEGDTSNFEFYEEVPMKPSNNDPFGNLFDFSKPYERTSLHR